MREMLSRTGAANLPPSRQLFELRRVDPDLPGLCDESRNVARGLLEELRVHLPVFALFTGAIRGLVGAERIRVELGDRVVDEGVANLARVEYVHCVSIRCGCVCWRKRRQNGQW